MDWNFLYICITTRKNALLILSDYSHTFQAVVNRPIFNEFQAIFVFVVIRHDVIYDVTITWDFTNIYLCSNHRLYQLVSTVLCLRYTVKIWSTEYVQNGLWTTCNFRENWKIKILFGSKVLEYGILGHKCLTLYPSAQLKLLWSLNDASVRHGGPIMEWAYSV